MYPFTTIVHEPKLNLDIEVSIYPPDEFAINSVFIGDCDIYDLLSEDTLNYLGRFIEDNVFTLVQDRVNSAPLLN